jgi:hypothetical protein
LCKRVIQFERAGCDRGDIREAIMRKIQMEQLD